MSDTKLQESRIDPTAVIAEGATIGNNVTIEPYAIIKEHVILKDGVTIKAHAYIDGHTTIGEGTTIYPCAVIGTKTQDLKFKGEITHVRIGKNCEIREFVTINSSCGEGSTVEVGDNCLIMAYCHVAHQCQVGNNVIMSNNATLAGHVTIGDHAIIGGLTAIHQFCKVGSHAMVGGMSRINYDIPPYTVGGGIPYKFGGINIVGLKRRNFPMETRQVLSKAFKLLYRSGHNLDEALDAIKKDLPQLPEVQVILDFCKFSQRGLMGFSGEKDS